jgi:hypothetical protein
MRQAEVSEIDQDVLDQLSCDLGARPPSAPTLDDVQPGVLSVKREATALLVGFDESMVAVFEAFAAAEQACCADLVWSVQDQSLRVVATPAQLDALALIFSSGQHS